MFNCIRVQHWWHACRLVPWSCPVIAYWFVWKSGSQMTSRVQFFLYISLRCTNGKICAKPGECFWWVQAALPQENLWTKDSSGDPVQPSSTQFNLVQPLLGSLLLLHLWKEDSSSDPVQPSSTSFLPASSHQFKFSSFCPSTSLRSAGSQPPQPADDIWIFQTQI